MLYVLKVFAIIDYVELFVILEKVECLDISFQFAGIELKMNGIVIMMPL